MRASMTAGRARPRTPWGPCVVVVAEEEGPARLFRSRPGRRAAPHCPAPPRGSRSRLADQIFPVRSWMARVLLPALIFTVKLFLMSSSALRRVTRWLPGASSMARCGVLRPVGSPSM